MSGTNNESLNIHWFPGHMAKTRRLIEENLKMIDVIAEITDARIPESGRNQMLNQISGNKPRVLLLNKSDYADESATRRWLEHYKSIGVTAVSCNCRSGAGLSNIVGIFEKAAGVRKYPGAVRVMAVGIPNSGKSSFINRMSGSKKTAVGDRPGVTRGKQWIAIGKKVEILDLPGILPPRFESDADKTSAMYLAYTGAVKDEVMDVYTLSQSLAEFLAENHPEKMMSRYNLSSLDGEHLENIAKSRGMMMSGGLPDTERAASALLDDFRSGKIGRITLEFPR